MNELKSSRIRKRKLKCLGDDAKVERIGMRREHAEEDGASGSCLNGRRWSFSVVDLKSAGDGDGGREGLFEGSDEEWENEDERKWFHDDRLWNMRLGIVTLKKKDSFRFHQKKTTFFSFFRKGRLIQFKLDSGSLPFAARVRFVCLFLYSFFVFLILNIFWIILNTSFWIDWLTPF